MLELNCDVEKFWEKIAVFNYYLLQNGIKRFQIKSMNPVDGSAGWWNLWLRVLLGTVQNFKKTNLPEAETLDPNLFNPSQNLTLKILCPLYFSKYG